jgi:hypothetical protein
LQFARGVRRKRGILDRGADRAQHERQRFGGIVATLGPAIVDVADPDKDGGFWGGWHSNPFFFSFSPAGGLKIARRIGIGFSA